MSAANETGYKTFTATATAIAKNIRVALDSTGLIAAAGVADDWIGTTVADVAASGTGTVRLRNAPGTHFFTASAAVTRGAKLYTTAAGKVDDADTTGFTGFEAAEAATADGDIIEAVPSCGALANVTVGSDIAAFTDPPSAAEMALLRTFVNALKVDVTAIRKNV
jgi:hypothetical protein